ncbi:MAG: AAA family ATPase [Phycisphaera sp.]|nr:AAA family ATPase [Phycisphaera sp.]
MTPPLPHRDSPPAPQADDTPSGQTAPTPLSPGRVSGNEPAAHDPDAFRRLVAGGVEMMARGGLALDGRGRLAEAPLRSRAVMTRLSDVQPRPVRWLWPGRIALGKLTILAGDPGLGKSFLTLDLASRVSTGAGWPDAPDERSEPGGVVLLSAEDDHADTIRPRLDAAGAQASRIHALCNVRHLDPQTGCDTQTPFTLEDIPSLESAIEQTPECRLVVIDPISAYTGKTDSHRNAEVRALLAPLGELAARFGVAVLAVTHLRKGEGAAIYRAMGSLAFVAAARSAWAVCRDPQDPTGKRRLLLPVKNNLGNDTTGLAFELRDIGNGQAHIAWDDRPVAVRIDEALGQNTRRPGPNSHERQRVMDWLNNALADGDRLASELIEEARDTHGISPRTLDRAKRDIDIRVYRKSVLGPYWWSLPNLSHLNATLPQHKELGDQGGQGNTKDLHTKRHTPERHIVPERHGRLDCRADGPVPLLFPLTPSHPPLTLPHAHGGDA